MLGTLSNFADPIYLVLVFLSATFAMFLFWRAGRYELLETELVLDTTVVGGLGSLLVGRLWDFLTNPDKYHFLVSRLIFFNAYGGIDFYGMLLGFAIFGGWFLRRKRVNPLIIFDLVAAPLSIFQVLLALTQFLRAFAKDGSLKFPQLYFAASYFVVFWILKRLAKRKRHPGFFACFYLVSIALVNAALFWAGDRRFIGALPYKLTASLGIMVFAGVCWYLCAKRSLKKDVRGALAQILLSVFKLRRTIASVDEGGNLARFVILSPYYLARGVFSILKFLGQEIIRGLFDFLIALGIKKRR